MLKPEDTKSISVAHLLGYLEYDFCAVQREGERRQAEAEKKAARARKMLAQAQAELADANRIVEACQAERNRWHSEVVA